MKQYDFDLHGFFRLRLIDATEREAAVVIRQLGPIAAPVSGDPDLIVRFVEKMPGTADLRYIGLNDAAYSDDAFFILKGKNKSSVKVMVPFEKIGHQAEILCERGINNIPLLIAIINLTMTTKGILPFHASAFTYKGKGILVTGWAKGGKTETLLAFMSQGASYVGDEWVYLCPDGTGMFGIPEPIRVWNWHLNSLPHYRARLKRNDRLKLQSLQALTDSLDWFAGPEKNGHAGAPAKLARRVNPLVKQQLYTHFAPHTLFGQDQCVVSSSIDQVIFAGSHDSKEITVEPITADEVVRRMVFSLYEEQNTFYSTYLKFRFAFPDRGNHWIDQVERIQKKLLEKALNGKEALSVMHPYPVHIPSLFDALHPFFD